MIQSGQDAAAVGRSSPTKPPEKTRPAGITRKARLRGAMPLRLAACRRVFLFLLLAAAAAVASAAAAAAESNSSANCTFRDGEIVRAAFSQVANFPLPLPGRRACRPVRRLRFPSRNLTGSVDWAELGSLTSLLTVDLSGNSLHGSINSSFWRAPLLRAVDVSRNHLEGVLRFDYPSTRLAALNVSCNRFTSVESVARLSRVVDLDVSRNAIGTVPEGLRNLLLVRVLNLSGNDMTGTFPVDLPPLAGLQVLDISHNNFSGAVDAGTIQKFGDSSFFQAGNALRVIEGIAPAPACNGGNKHNKRAVTVALVSVGAAVAAAALAFLVACVACALTRRRKKKRKKKDKDGKTAVWEDDEVVVGAVKVAAAAPVVVLERPLMELTLADLAAATSGFGRESQLADTGGRSGAAYRAVLPGDLHVVVRVVEGAVAGVAEYADAAATEAGFRELARLRHPNILPLLGYCIAGNQKLVLYEYMEKGDLHRWLHELPVGSMDTDDICIDTMEAIEDRKPAGDWPTRYRIILGIARGLAFLHQGWAGSGGRPIVHGRLVPTNILLGDDMEPRISDFLHPSGGGEETTPASDVYRFGTLVFEVVTGQARWGDASTTSWARGVIRNRRGLNLVDDRLQDETAGTEAEVEIAECLQVGFLCTASAPEKRPTMQQVVGVLKDVRPATAATTAGGLPVPVPPLGSLAS